MQSNRHRDTSPEVSVRRALHRAGFRFRKHYRALPGRRGNVDIAFPKLRIAVFVDGCFWHSCPKHATRPATNGDWWGSKLEATVARDRRTDAELISGGWLVLRFWEHATAAEVVDSLVAARESILVGGAVATGRIPE
jgi:DNA mismatch endonuclease (patch repair protein)